MTFWKICKFSLIIYLQNTSWNINSLHYTKNYSSIITSSLAIDYVIMANYDCVIVAVNVLWYDRMLSYMFSQFFVMECMQGSCAVMYSRIIFWIGLLSVSMPHAILYKWYWYCTNPTINSIECYCMGTLGYTASYFLSSYIYAWLFICISVM